MAERSIGARPSTPQPNDITQMLSSWRQGDETAAARLMPLVYDELRKLAGRYMRRERASHTLQATAVVHEAYLRMVGQSDPQWENRTHFFAMAAQVMRHLLVDHARSRNFRKRGGGLRKVSLDQALEVGSDPPENLLELDDALTRLAALDPRKARIVELRFFGGMSVEEVASLLDLSTATIVNETRAARAWLFADLSDSARPAGLVTE